MEYDQGSCTLYTPELESDACGIGMIVQMEGGRSHHLVDQALEMLERMEHRGAVGIDIHSGDGAGVMTEIPHQLIADWAFDHDISIDDRGSYAVGQFFIQKGEGVKEEVCGCIQQVSPSFGLTLVGVREVPVRSEILGLVSGASEPLTVQFVFQTADRASKKEYLSESNLYQFRSALEKVIDALDSAPFVYCCSLSANRIIYKGQLNARQLRQYYPDLEDPFYSSVFAMVHSRFSTNTAPAWELAQPFRCVAHNGEINTIKGNRQKWQAREHAIRHMKGTAPEVLGKHRLSDSATLDRVLEYLHQEKKWPIDRSIMAMIPEAWQNNDRMQPEARAFYEYHENIIEPWDGPAAICFSNGEVIGAAVDRNGLRPCRYLITKDGRFVLGSEVGILDIPFENISSMDRLGPGEQILLNIRTGELLTDQQAKERHYHAFPFKDWIEEHRLKLNEIPYPFYAEECEMDAGQVVIQQITHGYTQEDVDLILATMGTEGQEPIGSMGMDSPLPILSQFAQHVSHYFKQNFAQVTNPPIDPLREKFYMSLATTLSCAIEWGSVNEEIAKGIRLKSPVLSDCDYTRLRHIQIGGFVSADVMGYFLLNQTMGEALDQICVHIADRIEEGANVICLNNRKSDEEKIPIPSLLLVGRVHQYLIQQGLRQQVVLIVQAADLIETHHLATLMSYGADAVYPSLALDTIKVSLKSEGYASGAVRNASRLYTKALEKGLLKIMSKLGISTLASYKGSATFEALGIHAEVIDKCFTGTISRIGGMTFAMLEQEARIKHHKAFSRSDQPNLSNPGIYQWRKDQEYHLFNPQTIHLLQRATATNDPKLFAHYEQAMEELEKGNCTLRSLFAFNFPDQSIPLEEVETVSSICKRFATGAMSFGSISYEAHTTLAIAMNRIGGKSNSGEGGEDPIRYTPLPNGDSTRSAIKQVASGRFGVTSHYLVEADELQIKMAQGAKPGEGGQLPGHKVDKWIAKVRHATPGIDLISPPPHHDIYSIEDLAQLIYDLQKANDRARISVKLVARAGVGIIASGVVKAKAGHVLISGYDGGTGASPLSSIRHAGIPWEMGVSEAHQTLVRNGLRSRVRIQTDGQLRTARDLAIAAILGADEWGISTAALVVEGCILMRKCHLNTCPVGIATQDEELRKSFEGKVEHLIHYFMLLASSLRSLMAKLGVRTVDELVGNSQLLSSKTDPYIHWKAASIDLSALIGVSSQSNYVAKTPRDKEESSGNGYESLEKRLWKLCKSAIDEETPMSAMLPINNRDRAIGTQLSAHISRTYGSTGLSPGLIKIIFRGYAGQSFGAFGAPGLDLYLMGCANDYVGKGLSGARLAIHLPRNSPDLQSNAVLIGNVALYGAASGKLFVAGQAGDRFAVRNSGVSAVIEGVGDNGCEYMTGGHVVILGKVGQNFGAGMSGGIVYLFKPSNHVLEDLSKGDLLVESCDRKSIESVRALLEEHLMLTGSHKARNILSNWQEQQSEFVKIIPPGYKAILLQQEQLVISDQLSETHPRAGSLSAGSR